LTPVLILGFGGYLIIKGQLTLGTLIGFYSYLGWLYTPIRTLSSFYVSLQKSAQILERIESIYDLPEENEKQGSFRMDEKVEDITYENVSFFYDEQTPVLSGIDLRIEGNKSVAVVGPSGSGKSTLLSLLPRFYDPQIGSIRINGKDIRDYILSELRKNVIVVKQNDFLFNMSIRDNIVLDDDFTEEEFEEAVKIACVDKFMGELEDGYETIVGERGSKLSDGQRQRVAIARAIIRKPKVLILDEATSGVDSQTEEEIFKNLLKLDMTVIIVSHRLSTIRKAKRVLVLDRGKIIADGTHEELLKMCPRYRNIIEAQLVT